jgi:hypothetical protein
MAREFKMHRAGPVRDPARAGNAPLGTRAKTTAGRDRLVRRHGSEPAGAPAPVEEVGGPQGPEPTRYGDWEKNGICYDF